MHPPEGEPLDPFTFGAEQACFGCGPHNRRGLRLRFTRIGDEVQTRFTAEAGYEGPPGLLHGGLQATLADELAAWTVIGLRQRMGLTFSIQVRLLRPARIGLEITGRGKIVSEHDKSVTVKTTLEQEGKTILTGRIIYVLPDVGAAERTLGRTLPDAWRRFCG